MACQAHIAARARRHASVAALGLVLGLPLSYLATRSFAHLLYGVRPLDPVIALRAE